MAQRIGWDEALTILQEANQQEAFQRGRNMAEEMRRNGIEELIDDVAGWGFAAVGIGFFAIAWVFNALKGRV